MSKKRRKPKKSRSNSPDKIGLKDVNRSALRWPGVLALTVVICGTVAANLHTTWAAYPWLAAIALWAYRFWPERVETLSSPLAPGPFPYIHLFVVLAVAGVLRLYKLADLPLGPNVDEIFTLNNSIELLERPFDLFGHTPLIAAGWVETSNLYLYFNLAILKVFGVGYWSMKLFSVLPGILACGAVFLIGRLIFDARVAFWTALLFTFAHWPVRLSRYGWDVSFMVMAFAVTLWLLLFALQRGRMLFAYISGMIAGICLYSYLGARICVLSLLVFLFAEGLINRGRSLIRQCFAFVAGLTLVAFPLLCYYAANPRSFWVRTAELSVFNNAEPFGLIFHNIWRHALMFFTLGGTYARDNYPGLAMLDPVTGALLVAGLVIAVGRMKDHTIRLILLTFVLNFTPGIFSLSQEGAPYVYRSAAVMIPGFMISGMGMQWLKSKVESCVSSKPVELLGWLVVLLTTVLNLHFYFGLEAKNGAAMRIMAYEPRVLGLEIAGDNLPVFLLGRELFDSMPQAKTNEKYPSSNPPIIFPVELKKLAVITFSGRYDLTRTLSDNYEKPKDIYFHDLAAGEGSPSLGGKSAKLIFRSGTQIEALIRKEHPDITVREITNIYGEPLYSVATLSVATANIK